MIRRRAALARALAVGLALAATLAVGGCSHHAAGSYRWAVEAPVGAFADLGRTIGWSSATSVPSC